MANRWLSDLIGTFKSFFRIGTTLRLKNNTGALNVRNGDDSADAAITAAAGTFSGNVGVTGTVTASSTLQGSTLNLTGNSLVLNSDAAESGADYKITLARPTSGMTGSYTLTMPADDGSPDQVLGTDGSGTLSWVSAASTSALDHYDTTSLAHNSASTVTMFTLPANAVVSRVFVIVDTAFDGTGPTPSMSVGVNGGSASKYVGSSDVDLAAAGVYEVTPGHVANGSTEDLEISFTAGGGASAGAARVIVHYANPA